MAGWNRIRELLDEPIEPIRPLTLRRHADNSVVLDDVHYSHDGERDVLRGVDCDIPAGRTVAVVGATGAGKTTLLHLIAGLIAADSRLDHRAPSRAARSCSRSRSCSPARCARTSRSARSIDRRRDPDGAAAPPRRASSTSCPTGSTRSSASAASGCRAASASASRSPARWSRQPAVLLLDDTTSALDPATEAKVLANLRDTLARHDGGRGRIASVDDRARRRRAVPRRRRGRGPRPPRRAAASTVPAYRQLIRRSSTTAPSSTHRVDDASRCAVTEPISRWSAVADDRPGRRGGAGAASGFGATLRAGDGRRRRPGRRADPRPAGDRPRLRRDEVDVGTDRHARRHRARASSSSPPSAQRTAVARLGHRSEEALYGLRVRLFEHIHRLSIADHSEERKGALVARVTSDVETLAQFFSWGALAWLLDGTLMLMVAGVMLAYDWVLALVAFVVAAPLGFVLRSVQRHLVAAYDKAQVAQRRRADRGQRGGVGRRDAARRTAPAPHYADADQAVQPPSARTRSSAPARSARSCSRRARCSACSPWRRSSASGVIRGPESGLTAGALVGFIFLTYRFLEPIAEFTEVHRPDADRRRRPAPRARRARDPDRSARARRTRSRCRPGALGVDIDHVTFAYRSRGDERRAAGADRRHRAHPGRPAGGDGRRDRLGQDHARPARSPASPTRPSASCGSAACR